MGGWLVDSFERVTSHGWFGRIGGAIKGLIGGVVVLLVSFGLQFWNEGRTLKRDALLSEGRATVQHVAQARPTPAFDGKLVHVVGEASAVDAVSDEEFGVLLPALALRRRVEMYQWREKRERREEKKLGGGTREVTRYSYEKRWDDEPVDSSRFEQREGHENPDELPFRNETRRAETVKLGEFLVDSAVASEIGGWERVPVSQIELPPNLAASFRVDGDWFVTSADAESPAVGDVRVRFERVPAGTVSVVARQQGETLRPHATASGEELVLVERGEESAAAMFEAAGQRNSSLGWILRGVGFVLAFIGFGLLFRPLVVLADFVPLFGRLAGIGSTVAAAIFAALTSVLAISSGWLWYRPWLLGVVVLALVALGAWMVRARRAPSIAPPPPPSAAMPPPPPP